MNAHNGGARRLLAVGISTLLTGGMAIALAVPASASYSSVAPTTWVYTDSRDAHTSFINTGADAPIGSWRDDEGKHHLSRSYFEYDISSYQGKTIVDARMVFREKSANDCETPRTWELWRTTPITSTTSWANPPQEQSELGDVRGYACSPVPVTVNITGPLREAAANHQTILTLELRVPADVEGNLSYGRRVENRAYLVVNSNTPPGTPAGLTVDDMACDSGEMPAVRTTTPTVRARVEDPDQDGTLPEFTLAVWPLDRPEERVEWRYHADYPKWTLRSQVPAGLLRDGRSYAVTTRLFDGLDWSPWSAECRFTVDTQAPSVPPEVASSDYPADGQPHGGPGIAGQFTFSAAGVSDVSGYLYGFQAYGWCGYVQQIHLAAAPALGASATVSVTPTEVGEQTLCVRSIDRAGNTSGWAEYSFNVRYTAPRITDTNPDAWAGDPHLLIVQPGMENVVSYSYRVDDGAERTVAAAPDGSAQFSVVPSFQGSTVHVRSTTAEGLTAVNWIYLRVLTAPFITSDDFPGNQVGIPVGRPGTFTIRPHMHNVVEYTYQFNKYQSDQQPEQTVAAGADGTVTIPFTATRTGTNTLQVRSRTADGTVSQEAMTWFYPASIAPKVSSSVYSEGQTSGGVGVPGTFVFVPVAANVVEYLYTFGNSPQQTVTAAVDGSASVEWTPTSYDEERGGWVSLLVRSRSADGSISDVRYYSFRVNGFAPIVDGPTQAMVGQPVTFTFTAQLPGSVAFYYRFDSGEEQSVAVGPDGTATVSWIPQEPYYHFVIVRSRTSTGYISANQAWSTWVTQ